MVRGIFFSIAILFAFGRVCHMNTVNSYIYMEACEDRFCYAIREINVAYDTENQAVSLLCATPTPLDEEEILPRAIANVANIVVTEANIYHTDAQNAFKADQPCNDSIPVLFELITGESHAFRVSITYQDFPADNSIGEVALSGLIINIYPNNSVTVIIMSWNTFGEFDIDYEELMLNKTSLKCSVYEDVFKRAYYHIYGRLTINNLHYYYYFEVNEEFVLRNSASVLREIGGNEPLSLCMSYNGSAAEAEHNSRKLCRDSYMSIPGKSHSNFTVFAQFHDDKWHSLLWFDYLRWSKSYIPGNCSYEEQVFDGVMHPYAICMRRNVTEKFYKNITQGDHKSSTLRITTDYGEISSLAPSLLNQENIEETFSKIAEMKNITEDMVNNALSTLDMFLNSTQNAPQFNSSRILESLNSMVRNSCCDIAFVGDWSLVVRRHTVSCLETDSNKWPAMNEIPKKSYFDYHVPQTENLVFIEILYETVCSEKKNNEYIVIYYLFSNQVLFVEKQKMEPENACELRKRPLQNAPVLSAQLIDKFSMETIHQIDSNGKYLRMAKIMFPVQPAKLHGSTNLVYWKGEKWINVKNSNMLVANDHYVYTTSHLTDFTLVVDGLEMDPMLCDATLDNFSVMINFLSFAGLLTLIGHLSIKRYLPDDTTKKECSLGNMRKLPSKYEKTRLNYFVVLALFHLGFLLLSDSRDLFWPMSCDIATIVLYWLLLTCILITTLQSLHILKILASNSSFENLLIYVVGRKFILFITLGIPTTIVLIVKTAFPLFFDRQDYFCWIRPDYVVPAVVLPLSILGLNSAFIFVLIFIRIVSQGSFFGIYVTFGKSSVRTIISTSTASIRSVRSDNSSASLISNGAKYVEKAFTLMCIQLMLGIPWICQYLSIFAPQLTAAHYIFTIVIGSQGLIFFMLFCYRKIKKLYL